MTLAEIAVIIAKGVEKQFDPSFLEIVEELVKIWRAKIIRQRLNESKNEREYFKQYHVMAVEAVSDVECGRLGLPERCIVKTCEEVPKQVRTNIMFDYVGAINFRNPFGKTNSLRSLYNYATLTHNLPIWMVINNRIYVENYQGNKIGIAAIFENPSEITLCKRIEEGDNDCTISDVEYDCPKDVITDIITSIISTNMKMPGSLVNTSEVKQINEQ